MTAQALRPPVPLELFEFGLTATLNRLAEIGDVRRRDVPPSPDGGVIADFYGELDDPAELAARLEADAGVAAHGFFPADLVSDVIIGAAGGVEARAIP